MYAKRIGTTIEPRHVISSNVALVGLNNILLRNGMYNIHLNIYTYFCGTGSDRKLKAYINHFLKCGVGCMNISLRLRVRSSR